MLINGKNSLGCKLHMTQYDPGFIRKLVAIIFRYRKYLLSSNVESFSRTLKFAVHLFLPAHGAVSTLPPQEVCRRPKWGQHSRRQNTLTIINR